MYVRYMYFVWYVGLNKSWGKYVHIHLMTSNFECFCNMITKESGNYGLRQLV